MLMSINSLRMSKRQYQIHRQKTQPKNSKIITNKKSTLINTRSTHRQFFPRQVYLLRTGQEIFLSPGRDTKREISLSHPIKTLFIDQLSLLKDTIVDSQIQSTTLNTLENSFMKSLQTNIIQNQIFGKMQTLWKCLKEKQTQQKPTALDLLKTKVLDIQKTLSKNIESIKTFLSSQFAKVTQLSAYQLFGKSSLQQLRNIQNLEKLKAFFPLPIKSATLLYRASENNFSTKQFYQKAGLQRDMMIICKTKRGKVIGGYTPLVLKTETNYDHYADDPTFSTFIFSLTENDKFNQKSKENAIYRTFCQQRICFGGCEFQICDMGNIVQKCRSYSLNYYFENKNYQSNKSQSFEKFNGNKSEYFSVVQWEAWKMEFLKQ